MVPGPSPELGVEVAQRVALEHPVVVQGLQFPYRRSWTKVPLVLFLKVKGLVLLVLAFLVVSFKHYNAMLANVKHFRCILISGKGMKFKFLVEGHEIYRVYKNLKNLA